MYRELRYLLWCHGTCVWFTGLIPVAHVRITIPQSLDVSMRINKYGYERPATSYEAIGYRESLAGKAVKNSPLLAKGQTASTDYCLSVHSKMIHFPHFPHTWDKLLSDEDVEALLGELRIQEQAEIKIIVQKLCIWRYHENMMENHLVITMLLTGLYCLSRSMERDCGKRGRRKMEKREKKEEE